MPPGRRSGARSRLDFPPAEQENGAPDGKARPADAPLNMRNPMQQHNGQPQRAGWDGLSPDCPRSASASASPATTSGGTGVLHAQQLRMEQDEMFKLDKGDEADAHPRPPPVRTTSSREASDDDESRSECNKAWPSARARTTAFAGARGSSSPRVEDEESDDDALAFDPVHEERSDDESCDDVDDDEVNPRRSLAPSSLPAEAASSSRATPSTARARNASRALALNAAAAATVRGATSSGPSLFGEHSIVLEGFVVKWSDNLKLPRRRWLVVCDHRVFAYADAHGYLRGPPRNLAPRPRLVLRDGGLGGASADGGDASDAVESIGGFPTMSLDLRQCAILALEHTADELLIVPVHGERKRIKAGVSLGRVARPLAVAAVPVGCGCCPHWLWLLPPLAVAALCGCPVPWQFPLAVVVLFPLAMDMDCFNNGLLGSWDGLMARRAWQQVALAPPQSAVRERAEGGLVACAVGVWREMALSSSVP
jgi:hypothetical protein